jgi:hypothetical protein
VGSIVPLTCLTFILQVAALCIFGGFVAMLSATVAAGLLGFSLLRSWGGADARSGGAAAPVADVNFTAYEECVWTAFRLPASVVPVRYDLRLSVLQLAPPSEVCRSPDPDPKPYS